MTETRFRLLMGFFLCTAIAMLTLSEISIAQARTDEPGPGCQSPHAEMPGFPGPFAGEPHDRRPTPPAPGMPPMPPMLPNLQLVELTEAQQDKIFALGHEQLPQIREQLKIAGKAQDELHQLTLVEPFDKAKAQQLAQTQAAAMATVAVLHAEMEAAVRGLLTPEQRVKLDTATPCHRQP